MSAIDIIRLREWVGRTDKRHDLVSAAPVKALCASLNLPQALTGFGEPLPACWHWLYFADAVPTSELAVDGHARRGTFLPPVPLPRRMWAGSRVVFASPLQIGNEVSRVSTIQSVGHKKGRSGELVFVTVRHQIYHGERLAIEEEQDLVYRESATGSARGTAATKKTNEPLVAQWSRELSPDALLLFRYSALTFNSHRIHYDREYAVREEGYDGLVVQGPLTATLLLGLLDTELPFAQIEAFEFRAIRPLYEGAVLRLQGRQEGREVALWALDASGGVAMEARARLANE